jgi:Snf7
MASMNKGMNLPAIQRIMMEFEKQSSMMDMKEEMMADAIDDVMEDDEEDEEAEGDKILQAVLEEVGIDLQQKVRTSPISSGLKADIPTAWRSAYYYPFCYGAGFQQATGCRSWRRRSCCWRGRWRQSSR